MSWTIEQLLKHDKVNDLLGVNIKPKNQTTEKVTEVSNESRDLTFIVVGDPMGKPRMTRGDVWKKRPVVLRYRDYCDRIREAAPNAVTAADVHTVDVTAYIAMPASWSGRKQTANWGQIHRTKPDWDNIAKAVCDALFKDDSGIADGRARKYWCYEGEQCTEVKVYFFVHPT